MILPHCDRACGEGSGSRGYTGGMKKLTDDMVIAGKMLAKGLNRRKARKEVARLASERGPLPKNHYRVGVYFADSDVNIYQMRQWYAPLQELAQTRPVLLLARNAEGAGLLMEESGLDVAYVRQVTDIEGVLAEQPLEVMLYVNQNTRNFQMMRYGDRWHVFINHGESDKMYMTTNQYKTYDYAFVAGEAARSRLSKALWDYDVEHRTFEIGRPQTDHLGGEAPFAPDGRLVVLYAPTWEGDRPAARYGSVASHGEELVRRLIATGRHRVVYRPHPRSGVEQKAFGRANERIIQMLEEANRQDPSANHVYDTEPALGWQLRLPDIAICDVSAMVYDRLATGRPVMVTRPVDRRAELDSGGYLSFCEWLDAGDVADIESVLDRVIADEGARERLEEWSVRYFGDTSPGAPTRRFHEAIDTLLVRAEAEKRAQSEA